MIGTSFRLKMLAAQLNMLSQVLDARVAVRLQEETARGSGKVEGGGISWSRGAKAKLGKTSM